MEMIRFGFLWISILGIFLTISIQQCTYFKCGKCNFFSEILQQVENFIFKRNFSAKMMLKSGEFVKPFLRKKI